MRRLWLGLFCWSALAQDVGVVAERYYQPLIERGQSTAAAFAASRGT